MPWSQDSRLPPALPRVQRYADVAHLLVPWHHSSQARRQRTLLLVSRARAVALAFAVLVPLWSLIDMLVFAPERWRALLLLRLATGAALLLLAVLLRRQLRPDQALGALFGLMTVPAAFLLGAVHILDGDGAGADAVGAETVRAVYTLLPFAMLAGLSLFPLTALEMLLLATPLLLSSLAVAAHGVAPGLLWLQVLVLGTAMVSSLSQVQYLTALVRQASNDALTGTLNRQAGIEAIELLFRLSMMHDTPLAVMFVDIDQFKAINDRYGHDEGDRVLRTLAGCLRQSLRKGDTLIRWGGEEFLVVLGNTDARGARIVVERLREHGLGARPDGAPLTASLGVAERRADRVGDWPELIEIADRRMYQAKGRGAGRAMLPGGEEIA